MTEVEFEVKLSNILQDRLLRETRPLYFSSSKFTTPEIEKIVKIIASFLEIFQKFIKYKLPEKAPFLLKENSSYGFLWSGGSFLEALQNKPIPKNSDIDLWIGNYKIFKYKDEILRNSDLKFMYENIYKSFEKFYAYVSSGFAVFSEVAKDVVIIKAKRYTEFSLTFSFKIKGEEYKIQVISPIIKNKLILFNQLVFWYISKDESFLSPNIYDFSFNAIKFFDICELSVGKVIKFPIEKNQNEDTIYVSAYPEFDSIFYDTKNEIPKFEKLTPGYIYVSILNPLRIFKYALRGYNINLIIEKN